MCKNKGNFIRRVGTLDVDEELAEIPEFISRSKASKVVNRREMVQPSRRHENIRKMIQDVPPFTTTEVEQEEQEEYIPVRQGR